MITPEIKEPKNTRILSFDPGEMTGISFLLEGMFQWGMVASPECFRYESFLQGLTRSSAPTIVVVEDVPLVGGFYNKDQYDVWAKIIQWYGSAGYEIAQIKPGYWKGLVSRTKVDSTHIRDSADMGSWYYLKHNRENRNVIG